MIEINSSKFLFFRSMARTAILNILGSFSRPAPGIHILNGHRKLNKDESPDVFRQLLKQLSRKVEFIRIEEAVRLISRNENPKKPLVAFTFDDGFSECYTDFAPILEGYGINGLFFINPNFVSGDDFYIDNFTNKIVLTPGKRPMSWDEIKELQLRGHIIGAHTMDHCMINSDNEKILEYQVVRCKSAIEEKLLVPCDYFAFPYGKLEHANRHSIDIACKNYKYVFSQSDYRKYFSYGGRVINRRHFEPFWPSKHVYYFLSCHKKYTL